MKSQIYPDTFVKNIIEEYNLPLETEEDRTELLSIITTFENYYLLGEIYRIIIKNNFEKQENKTLDDEEIIKLINAPLTNLKFKFKKLDTSITTTEDRRKIYNTINTIKKINELAPNNVLIDEVSGFGKAINVNNWMYLFEDFSKCKEIINLYYRLIYNGMAEHMERVTKDLDKRIEERNNNIQELDKQVEEITLRRIKEIGIEATIEEMQDDESILMKEINKLSQEKAIEYINKKNGE